MTPLSDQHRNNALFKTLYGRSCPVNMGALPRRSFLCTERRLTKLPLISAKCIVDLEAYLVKTEDGPLIPLR